MRRVEAMNAILEADLVTQQAGEHDVLPAKTGFSNRFQQAVPGAQAVRTACGSRPFKCATFLAIPAAPPTFAALLGHIVEVDLLGVGRCRLLP